MFTEKFLAGLQILSIILIHAEGLEGMNKAVCQILRKGQLRTERTAVDDQAQHEYQQKYIQQKEQVGVV